MHKFIAFLMLITPLSLSANDWSDSETEDADFFETSEYSFFDFSTYPENSVTLEQPVFYPPSFFIREGSPLFDAFGNPCFGEFSDENLFEVYDFEEGPHTDEAKKENPPPLETKKAKKRGRPFGRKGPYKKRSRK